MALSEAMLREKDWTNYIELTQEYHKNSWGRINA